MCGVIAYFPRGTPNGFNFDDQRRMFTRVMQESKVRGLHAFGLANWWSDLGRSVTQRSHSIDEIIDQFEPSQPTIAHCRYSTSGDWHDLRNCQPVVAGEYSLVFNGVIHMGTKEEFEREFRVKCESDNDGEVFLRQVIAGYEPGDFIHNMRGSFAGAWLHGRELWIGRNSRRPLWRCEAGGATWVTSTSDIMKRAGLPPGEEVRPGIWRIQ